MKKLIIATLLTFQMSLGGVYACSCIFVETFCESIGPSSEQIWMDIIALGRVKEKTSRGMYVEIIDPIYGDASSNIFIRKGNGADCGISTDIFPEGSLYIFGATEYYDKSEGEMYWLNSCLVSYLEFRAGNVIGAIAGSTEQQNYTDFRKGVKCNLLESLPKNQSGALSASVFPNPTAQNIWFVLNTDHSQVDYNLFSLDGKIILKGIRKELEAGIPNEIDLQHLSLPAGFYILQIRSELMVSNLRVGIAR